MATKDQQVKHVVEGLALGVLAQGVGSVTSAKMELEFAFNYSWRRWPKAPNFPSIGGHDPGNLFWIGLGKSERRQVVRAAWKYGRWVEPYVTLDGWTVDECLELHADERATTRDWEEFGRIFVERFKPEQLRRVAD